MTFQLHPQLENDCISLGNLRLSRLLLMNDCQFPWFILVPEIEGIIEIFQLEKEQRIVLMEESSELAEVLHKVYQADKINIASIGNLVPQLHVHHIVRYRSDKAWPAPVWGKFSAVPYTEQAVKQTVQLLSSHLDLKY